MHTQENQKHSVFRFTLGIDLLTLTAGNESDTNTVHGIMECFYNQGICITFSHIKHLYYDNDDTSGEIPPPVHKLVRFSHQKPGSRGVC